MGGLTVANTAIDAKCFKDITMSPQSKGSADFTRPATD